MKELGEWLAYQKYRRANKTTRVPTIVALILSLLFFAYMGEWFLFFMMLAIGLLFIKT